MLRTASRLRVAAALAVGLALLPLPMTAGAGSGSGAALSGPAASEATGKLRGGLDRLLAIGVQPDARLDYLVDGYRAGDFVVYAVVDRAARTRVADVRAAGARVRWALRSVPAISLVADGATLMRLAAKPWVRALYPVLSGRVDDTSTNVSGTMTAGQAPAIHSVPVEAGAATITVDLTVAPPGQPHTDANAVDQLQARLRNPDGHIVMARPLLLHQIAFRYAPGDLAAGEWTLEIFYRKANQPTVPILYTYTGTVAVATAEVTRDAPEPAGNGNAACEGPADSARWRNNPNLRRRGVTDLGAPTVWDRGIRGRGVRLAILDTGVDGSHADLDEQDFEHWDAAGCTGKIAADALFAGGQTLVGQGATDVGGHGSHVAGEAAGTAEGAGQDQWGTYPGVAPEATLIAGRIAIDVTALTDDMIAALEWAVIDQHADVINLSFGIDVRYGALNDPNDPQSAAFEAIVTDPAWGHPTIMTSAGNSGDRFNTIGSPGPAPHITTVAATVKDWDLALADGQTTEAGATVPRGVPASNGKVRPSITSFSSRGPSADFGFAPDLAAPGRSIMAAKSNQNTDGDTNGYASFSGTSMASPHAAGAATLVVDAFRRAFGAAGAYENRPPFWLVVAALSNTAGTVASRPAYAGGALATVDTSPAGALLQLHGEIGSRENDFPAPVPVGPLVEGAGRINVPAAIDAITGGIVIYTAAAKPSAPAMHEWQSSFQAGTVKPQQTTSRTLTLHPATARTYSVSLRAAAGAASVNAATIDPSWWTLPAATSVSGRAPKNVAASLTIPASAKPGHYTGYLLADVTDTTTGVRTTLRMPVLAVVEITDANAGEGPVAVNGFTKAIDNSGPFTGASGIESDFPIYAIDAPDGLERLDLTLAGTGSDTWDLFVYDRWGNVVADTFLAPPGPASLSLAGLLPGEYRVAVSLTLPEGGNTAADGPRGRAFTLTADLVGAASAKVLGTKKAAPAPKPAVGPLPATGVGSAGGTAAALLALAAAVGLALSPARGRERLAQNGEQSGIRGSG
ncbi:MAG TPA: S8 family serine peptidase [Actinomycetota bacterium]